MPAILAAAQPVIVKVPEASGGASVESILVFIGGVLAAIAAVAASIITTRGASSRLERQLISERERFDKQLTAEAERFNSQFAHERYLARRAEVSSVVERVSRLVAALVSELGPYIGSYLRDSEPSSEQIDTLDRRVDELIGEGNVIALRFGGDHPMVASLFELIRAMKKAVDPGELPLSGEKKEELEGVTDEVARINAVFLVEAKKGLDRY